MKALFVAHTTDFSGANKSLYSIICQLKNKIKITVLVNKKSGELVDKLQSDNIDLIYTRYSWWVTTPRKNIIKRIYRYSKDKFEYSRSVLTSSFIDSLRKQEFDLVYTNTSTVDIGARIAEELDIPHFWHVREFGKEDFSFISLVSESYRKKVFNSAKKIIVISDALKYKYKNIVPKDKIGRIYNGFEIDRLEAPESKHNFDNKITVLVTGQVCEGKGQIQAIQAVADLYKKNYPVELLLAGNVDHSYLDPILKKYPSYSKWLKVLGQVKDIYSLRDDVDIELVCSRSEAFGRVTLEAMLHSIPVIGSNSGGNPELIENGKNGLLFEYGHPEELEERIVELTKNREVYDEIVKNAANFAKKFTIEKTAAGVYKTFKENM